MSNTSLIIGESGTGKSTSLRNLDSTETFIINIIDKPLPFRGYKSKYKKMSSDWKEGNYFATDDHVKIIKAVNFISNNRPDIKTIIIDDFQFVMTNEFMQRSSEKGYDKFTEIAKHAWQIMQAVKVLREDIDIFILCHSTLDDNGKMNVKTIGKLFSEKYPLEGSVTMLLQTEVVDGKYSFITQGDARHIAKSPMDMFEDRIIPNDLAYVKATMASYYNQDIPQ